MATGFFDEQTESSEIKAKIVDKYFWHWSTIMKSRSPNIAYIDLFAGPGRYETGKMSTPLRILETALEDPQKCRRLQTVFNDRNPEHIKSLKKAVADLPNIDKLFKPPQFLSIEVSDAIAGWFEEVEFPPSLVFFDPWGYKGLSLNLIDAALKSWGSDLIFFFNYNRINMGIGNKFVSDHMEALFGAQEAKALRKRVDKQPSDERELIIVNAVGEALLARRANYVLPFRFRAPNGSRTSHYLFFASKHVLGYKIMKDVMYAESLKGEDGVASFEYTPVHNPQLGLLFQYYRRIDELRADLLTAYRGRTLTMDEIFQDHHVGTPYVEKNYKDILVEMEAAGEVSCLPPASKRPKRNGKPTMAKHVRVTFP